MKAQIMQYIIPYIKDTVIPKHAAFIKRHSDESYIPLHQDPALWERAYKTAITVWVALTESTAENGGMFYYDKNENLLNHEFDIAYPMFKHINLTANGITSKDLQDINLNTGDIALWTSMTPHGSHKNKSGQLRVGIPIVFINKNEQGD